MIKKIAWLFGALIVAFSVGFVLSQRDQDPPTTRDNISENNTVEVSGGITLDLSGKQLTMLNEEILRQTNITTLNISNNQLTSLDGIERLSNLQVLNVENNRLERFSPQIAQLSNLRQIFANNNRLQTIPPEATELINLTFLDISGNSISDADTQTVRAKLPNTEIKN